MPRTFVRFDMIIYICFNLNPQYTRRKDKGISNIGVPYFWSDRVNANDREWNMRHLLCRVIACNNNIFCTNLVVHENTE